MLGRCPQQWRVAISDNSQKKSARWSFPREILLRRDKIGPCTVGMGRQGYELLVVAPGLRSIAGPFGGPLRRPQTSDSGSDCCAATPGILPEPAQAHSH